MRTQEVRVLTGDPEGDWDWPSPKMIRSLRSDQIRPDHVAEYEAAEKSQDQKDFLTACLILGPSILMMGLGIDKAVELLAGWIA